MQDIKSPPELPERIGRLHELASNLWWAWHPRARDLFRALDYQLWKSSGHNPVKQLSHMSPGKLQAASHDPGFLGLYDSVMSSFDMYMSDRDTWFNAQHRGVLPGPIAYFSMEFAIHNSLPIYAGGLGVLAGDTCKEASDVGIPMVAVGFMYPQGYFHQCISADCWQQCDYRQLNFGETPLCSVCSPQGSRMTVQIQLQDRPLSVAICQVQLGRTNVYLLDTDLEANAPADRNLSSRLYTADREQRIEQEVVLGVAGVRALRALGIEPSLWHANEGHTSFMMLERIREFVQAGAPLEEALHRVRATTVFTTHTPVAAATDVFPVELVERYLRPYWQSLGLGRQAFIALGQQDGGPQQTFNMTVLGLKTSDHLNGVSRMHGRVARTIWHSLWPGLLQEQVPISHVTNGVHLPTWLAPELERLFETHLGADWLARQDDPALWERVADIPDEELWYVRRVLKRKLLAAMLERSQKAWRDGLLTAEQHIMMGSLLDFDVLTIGFARRFATYKRPALLFEDAERLERIVTNPLRPVQIVFAGKAHPADFEAQYLIHHVYSLAKDRRFQGRIAFAEDYDMHLAHYLTQGVDVWLNTPRRGLEGCGTSGMKAGLNGVPHLSIRDGWWDEGYNGRNGWVIADARGSGDSRADDRLDAVALYRLLEEEIVPLFYERDAQGVPVKWLRLLRETIRSVAPAFCARRMMKEYADRLYMPAALSLRA